MTTLTIPESYHGQRLDKALAQMLPEYSRAALTEWLKQGVITFNGQKTKPSTCVVGGEELAWQDLPSSSNNAAHEAEDIPLNIVFEDEHLLVINKPAGLVVHPGAGNKSHTLLNALLHHQQTLGDLPRAGIVHRLDKDTSGLLMIAKTLQAHTQLIRQMQAREIKRHYLALVQGHVIAGNTINTGFGRDPRNRLRMAVLPQGRTAITQYSVVQHFGFATLLDVSLQTGRTHQIRVHMAHINHPLIGDSIYQGRQRLYKGMTALQRETILAFPRQALHAASLTLNHPMLGEELILEADLPYDFETLLNTITS